jgi:hypothetical protein
MAVAVARRHAPRAYLVAGAPVADWQDSEGSELFQSGTWMTSDLLKVYAHLWTFWRGDVKTHPVLLPIALTTHHATTGAMEVSGRAWELRSVEVWADDREWVPVELTG